MITYKNPSYTGIDCLIRCVIEMDLTKSIIRFIPASNVNDRFLFLTNMSINALAFLSHYPSSNKQSTNHISRVLSKLILNTRVVSFKSSQKLSLSQRKSDCCFVLELPTKQIIYIVIWQYCQNKRYSKVTLSCVVKVFMCQCVVLFKCRNSRDIIFVTRAIFIFIRHTQTYSHITVHTEHVSHTFSI